MRFTVEKEQTLWIKMPKLDAQGHVGGTEGLGEWPVKAPVLHFLDSCIISRLHTEIIIIAGTKTTPPQ